MQYYILKQFLPDTQIWVWKLKEEDMGYVYDNPEQAEDMCLYLKSQDPSRDYKVSTTI
jgi:hypothetical protein